MKKKSKLLNILMVVIIVIMVAAGVLVALWLSSTANYGSMGSEFNVKPIKNNSLTFSDNPENTCTVTILCDTVLNNLDKLEDGKLPYVPESGIILNTTSVEFTPGETAFDVLQRVCEAAEIQLEFSWTPLYDSYYIEGINHLYEFDCGFESGWMYKVNEWFPNYGCSSYEMKNGDNMVWCYTCVGLGTDVGGNNWQK